MLKKPILFKEEDDRWIETEFQTLDLGDARLNKRLKLTVENIFKEPTASIPKAMRTWKDTKGAYRLFDNHNVSHKKILTSHQQTSQKRIGQFDVVLAVQDTTSLNYTKHTSKKDMGSLGSNKNIRGMYVHTTAAYTVEGIPLGIIHQKPWVRPREEFGKKKERKNKFFEEKESIKWYESLEATENIQQQIPDTKIISVGDRESDIFELFHRANSMKIELLIRAAQNRCIDEGYHKLWSYMHAQPISKSIKIQIPRNKNQKKRKGIVDIRYAKVHIKPPKTQPTLKPVVLNAVFVHESNPPAGSEPISWMLLTTLEIQSSEDAIKCVEYYAIRWNIEVFHKILKSGCKIEERQLVGTKNIEVFLAVCSVVAWRIQLLTMLGRTVPNLPCSAVFEECQWQALYCFVNETIEPPTEAPSLQEAIILIGKLGGFLNRTQDKYPGVKTIWLGLQKLEVITDSWKSFGPKKYTKKFKS